MRLGWLLLCVQALDRTRGLLRRAPRAGGVVLTVAAPADACAGLHAPWADTVLCSPSPVPPSGYRLWVNATLAAVRSLPPGWTRGLAALPSERVYAGLVRTQPAPPGLPADVSKHPLFALPFARDAVVVTPDVAALLRAPGAQVWAGPRWLALLCAREGIAATPLGAEPAKAPASDRERWFPELVPPLRADLQLPGSLGFTAVEPWWRRAQRAGPAGYDLALGASGPQDLFWWQLMDGEFMLPGTTCGGFSYHVHSGGVSNDSHVGAQECSQYLLDTLHGYKWAKQLIGKRVEVSDLVALNRALGREGNGGDLIPELFDNKRQGGQYTAREVDPRVDALRTLCTGRGGRTDRWCLAPDTKLQFGAEYLDAYHRSVAALPPPSARGEAHWDRWLDAASLLLARTHMLHTFRDGNSRTRVILLDVLLAQNGLHPVLLWNFKRIAPVQATVKSGLAAWEASVATRQNAWRFLAHVATH